MTPNNMRAAAMDRAGETGDMPFNTTPGAADALTDAIRAAEISHSGMSYGDEKTGSLSEYARGWGDCLKAIKRASTPSDECSHGVKLYYDCPQCNARKKADTASFLTAPAAVPAPAPSAPDARQASSERFCNKCGYFGPDMQHDRPNGSGRCGYLSYLSTSQPAVPEGWQLVPVEPTTKMIVAYNTHDIAADRPKHLSPPRNLNCGAYAAMLKAAQEPQS